MPYDDDDDLFGEEFDFVDEDDDASEGEPKKKEEAKEKPAPKPKRRAPARDKAPAERPKPRSRGTGASGTGTGGTSRRSSRANEEPAAPVPPPLKSPERLYADDADDIDDDDDSPVEVERVEAAAPVEESVPEPVGPPADHVVHIYEYGTLKRTIPRKFTDEEAVNFAEEYTRTGKNYGRYAVATPEDEEPSDTFAGASKGG